MNGRNLYSYLFTWLFICSLTSHSLAQTITTGSVTPSSICPGGTVSVSFTISGTFAAGNKFSAQLSDAAGTFPASPAVIGSITSTTVSAISATIPASTANGSYRIQVVSSSPAVSSSTSSPLTVNVPSAPGTSSLSYCVGQTATALTASAAGGAILNWYGTNAIGGTASLVAPTPSTTAVSSTTYYVSQTQNGCESPRASLVVTVSSAPAAPTANIPAPYCQGTTATALVASGSNLKWYDASNNLLNGAPKPNTDTPGSTTYYVSQSVGSCESPRTAIPVVVKPAPGAPGTSEVAFCQGATAPTLTITLAANATPNWYGTNPTSGTATATAPVLSNTAVGTTTYYVSQTLDGCESPRAALNVRVRAIPAAPAPVVAAISFCNNSSASQLTANGANLKWYDASDKLLGEAPTPGTGTVGDQIFKVSQTVEGCEGPKASLTVTIKPLPAAPVGNAPAPYCQGVTASPLSATGTGLLWYGPNQTGGNSSATPTIPTTGTPGNTTYYVTQTVNGCESTRAGIVVTVKSKPGLPGTAAVDFCQGAAPPVLTATLLASATPNWYGTSPTSGTATTTTPIPSNTTPGTTVYYVSQTLDGCESDRASLSVRVKDLPAVPGVAAINVCQNSPAITLSATASSGGTLNWYGTVATGGTSSTTAPSPPTSTTGSTTYYVSQSVNGCEGPRVGLVVTVNPPPALPTVTTPAPYCQGVTASPLSSTGISLKWYGTNQTGGTGDAVAPTPNTNNPGNTTYYVTQTVNGCESTRAGIVVTVKPKPGLPGTAAVDFCQGAIQPVLTATLLASATPNWYGTSPTSGTATATAPVPSNATPGTTVYYVSQTLDGCESNRASLPVRVKPLPAIPGVAAIGFCNNGLASQLSASGANLKWYDASDNFLSGGAPIPGTGTVGNQTFKVSQTVEGCEGPKANLVVTIKPLPAPPPVTNLTYCLQTQDQPAQNVTPLNAFGENLKWYNADNSFTTVAPTPTISQTGVQNYIVSQTYNGCEGGKSTLLVTVRTATAPTVARSLVTYCINDKAVPLEATGETGGSLRWINPYNVVSNEAPTPYTLNTSIQAGGDPFYVYQIGQNGCYSERSVTKVLVNAPPTLALITPVSSVNLGQRVALQLKFTSVPPYSYTLTDGYSGVANKTDTTISVLPRANTTYQVITVRNSCGVGLPGNPATATITVRVPTVTTSALTTATLCAGTSLAVPFTTTGEFNTGNLFRLELVSVADTAKKYAVPATATASPITAPVPLTLVGGQYYVRVKADNPEIAIVGSNSPTLLTVRPQPTATLTGTQNIYEGFPANLTLTFGGDSPWTVTVADSVRSYSATTTTNPYLLEVRPSRSNTYQLVSVTNSCGNGPVSGTATVTVLPLLGIVDNDLGPLVKTYPVPTTSILTVELDLVLTRDPATLLLTDISGKPVLQQTTRNRKQELDLIAQPDGLYLLRIQVGDRQTVRKVLKQ